MDVLIAKLGDPEPDAKGHPALRDRLRQETMQKVVARCVEAKWSAADVHCVVDAVQPGHEDHDCPSSADAIGRDTTQIMREVIASEEAASSPAKATNSGSSTSSPTTSAHGAPGPARAKAAPAPPKPPRPGHVDDL